MGPFTEPHGGDLAKHPGSRPVVVALDLNDRASAARGGLLRCVADASLLEEGAEFVNERRVFFQLRFQVVRQNLLRAAVVRISGKGCRRPRRYSN